MRAKQQLKELEDLTEERLADHETAVLQKLAMLMEAPALNYDATKLANAKPGSTSPRDYEPLLEEHKRKFQRLKKQKASIPLRQIAIWQAEHDYQTAKKRPPAYIDRDSDQNRKDRDEAILRWLDAGKRLAWIAVTEGCSTKHVERLRKAAQANNVRQD